jgi:hypothetical protein
MRTASLIAFTMKTKGRTPGEVSKFYRELYGYRNCSHYGRYHTQIKGVLDKVQSIRYANGVFMVRKADARKVLQFLRSHGAMVAVWDVLPKTKEWKVLQAPVA